MKAGLTDSCYATTCANTLLCSYEDRTGRIGKMIDRGDEEGTEVGRALTCRFIYLLGTV